MPHENPERCEVSFSGNVQGVGFRFRTVEVASSYKITGYVMNCTDGRVRLVVEGPRSTVSALIQSVRNALGSYITNCAMTWTPATGEFQDFSIRRVP
jgi:acylphosphatase